MQSMPTRHARKFRRKSTGVVVEACLVTDDNASEISNWANGAQIVEEEDMLTHAKQEGLNVKTPNGKKRASVGMYVIKHSGLFFVSQPGMFLAGYEAVE